MCMKHLSRLGSIATLCLLAFSVLAATPVKPIWADTPNSDVHVQATASL